MRTRLGPKFRALQCQDCKSIYPDEVGQGSALVCVCGGTETECEVVIVQLWKALPADMVGTPLR